MQESQALHGLGCPARPNKLPTDFRWRMARSLHLRNITTVPRIATKGCVARNASITLETQLVLLSRKRAARAPPFLRDKRACGFFKVIDTLRDTQPMVAILENVVGFLRCKDRAMRHLLSVGDYWVWLGILDPAKLGFPASKQRLYIIMIRNDVKVEQGCIGIDVALQRLKCTPEVAVSSMLFPHPPMAKKRKRHEQDGEANCVDRRVLNDLSRKPTKALVRKYGGWLETHWAFIQDPGLDQTECAAGMVAASDLPLHAKHIVGSWRSFFAKKGEPLEVINVSQSIHRAGGSNKDLMPCVTPSGAFWVEQAQRVICQ